MVLVRWRLEVDILPVLAVQYSPVYSAIQLIVLSGNGGSHSSWCNVHGCVLVSNLRPGLELRGHFCCRIGRWWYLFDDGLKWTFYRYLQYNTAQFTVQYSSLSLPKWQESQP